VSLVQGDAAKRRQRVWPTPVFEDNMTSNWVWGQGIGLGLAVSLTALTFATSALAIGPSKIEGQAVTETEVVEGKKTSPMLTVDSFQLMEAAEQRYQDIIENGGFPKVPKGTYKKGSTAKGTVELNKRLFIEGYLRREATEGEYASIVTSATVEALTRFQRNMGLAATGKMDGPTLAALNVPAEQRLRTIQANKERLRVYSENLGDRYVVVNVPAMQIETVSNGRVFSRHNAIVGRPERPTPVVMTALSDINFNPYWNAPPSIIERDIFPKLRSGTQILEEMNIRVFQGFGGPEIDPSTVSWGSAVADDYHFRQEPGPGNAMATAKINFPSPFGIYLHDTPEQHLFKSGKRFYSSGCVRVEKVATLLDWVLNGQDGIGTSEISALAETLEPRDVKLAEPPQLRVTYLTAWPVGKTVAFRSDVYELDGTGFVVGQPMPVGEVSDDGQRFVLKPIPRKAAQVDAAEAEGIGLFGSRLGGGAKKKPKKKSFFTSGADDIEDGVNDEPVEIGGKKKKPPFEVKKKGKETGVVVVQQTAKKPKPKAKGKDKDVPGLFDWASYRKEKKLGGKKTAEKVTKKKVTTKKSETKVAVAEPKDKLDLKKKPVDAKKVAAVDPKKAVTKDVKKPVVAEAKKPEAKDAKKVAAVDPKKPVKEVKKTTDTAAKKPADDKAKKVAESCKPDATGKLPKACKAPAAKKP
jgi:L,D-transpeptidase YcbB